MKAQKFLILLLLFVLQSDSIFSQTFVRKTITPLTFNSIPQIKQWYIPNGSTSKKIQFSGSSTSTPLVSSGPAQTLTNIGGFNSYMDEQGRLLFYVISTNNGLKLFDKNNSNIELPNELTTGYFGKEVVIVPILNTCEGRKS